MPDAIASLLDGNNPVGIEAAQETLDAIAALLDGNNLLLVADLKGAIEGMKRLQEMMTQMNKSTLSREDKEAWSNFKKQRMLQKTRALQTNRDYIRRKESRCRPIATPSEIGLCMWTSKTTRDALGTHAGKHEYICIAFCATQIPHALPSTITAQALG
jgi:hypothetical protein